mmetsp:Transcript_5545/g.9106  ORF Transcript_5545/g.9106 Transcript_5545/m.9106 type:complete len:97 (+) Transcript_5545:2947-3237(+)
MLDPMRVAAQDASNSRLSCASSLVGVPSCGAECGCTNAVAASNERRAMVKALIMVDIMILLNVELVTLTTLASACIEGMYSIAMGPPQVRHPVTST